MLSSLSPRSAFTVSVVISSSVVSCTVISAPMDFVSAYPAHAVMDNTIIIPNTAIFVLLIIILLVSFIFLVAPAFLPFYPIYRWKWENVAKKMKFLITKARAALPTITQLWLSITPVTHFPPQLYRFSSNRQSHT